jgi:hypothetical protein
VQKKLSSYTTALQPSQYLAQNVTVFDCGEKCYSFRLWQMRQVAPPQMVGLALQTLALHYNAHLSEVSHVTTFVTRHPLPPHHHRVCKTLRRMRDVRRQHEHLPLFDGDVLYAAVDENLE